MHGNPQTQAHKGLQHDAEHKHKAIIHIKGNKIKRYKPRHYWLSASCKVMLHSQQITIGRAKMAGQKDADGLTPKQRKYVQGVASGLSLAEAYRQAYDAAAMSDKAIRTESAKLIQHQGVALALQAIRARREAQNQILTVSDRDMVLRNLRQWTKGEGEPPSSAQLRAAELLGKACGLYKDVVETRTERPAADILGDIEKRLNALQASEPDKRAPESLDDASERTATGSLGSVNDGPIH